jgi:hypothetical protein
LLNRPKQLTDSLQYIQALRQQTWGAKSLVIQVNDDKTRRRSRGQATLAFYFKPLAFAAIMCLGSVAAAQQPIPVSFARGQSSATLTGTIKGDESRNYTVDARAGQTLTVTLKSTRGSAEMNVWAPVGDTALSAGSPDPYRFSKVLPANGHYRIQTYQMRAAARRGDVASYTMTIAVTGKPSAAAGVPASDAKVAGTNYNATADIPCTLATGVPAGRCAAGVTRLGGGEATVEIRLPTGKVRHIYFKDGRAAGHDVYKAGFSVRREGDMNIVKVGPETYRIADALVVGG